jgi:hypothetical protein
MIKCLLLQVNGLNVESLNHQAVVAMVKVSLLVCSAS